MSPRESLLELPSHDLEITATGAETTEDGEPAELEPGKKYRVRYVSHRITAKCVIYTFARIPGGMFDRIETRGLPKYRKAPEKKTRDACAA